MRFLLQVGMLSERRWLPLFFLWVHVSFVIPYSTLLCEISFIGQALIDHVAEQPGEKTNNGYCPAV